MIEEERRRRIQVSLWAYAYEICNDSLVADAVYDQTCLSINPEISTGHLDDFFRTEFNPSTGMWIYKHPELNKLAALYTRLTGNTSGVGDPLPKSEERSLPVATDMAFHGFKTQTEVKLYLASLGFNVVPDRQKIGDKWFDVEYDTDFAHYTCAITRESRSIRYADILGKGY